LPESVTHHLVNVMRLRPGQLLVLFDGEGTEQDAELVAVDGPQARVRMIGSPRVVAASPELTLILAVLKHQPMDLAVRMATEAGVSRIVPVLTQRTVAKGDRSDRWQRILDSASAQCGRARSPVLEPVADLRVAVESHEGPVYTALPGAGLAERATGAAAICIGPAGGFSPAEVDWLTTHTTPVGLGPHVLRAETAAVVAVSLIRPEP
jgi:16S rRNA (uracil1498-N3)-methyltransferase